MKLVEEDVDGYG